MLTNPAANPVRDALRFDVPGGKARLTVHPLPEHDPDTLLMMTVRAHDQYNTTVYTPNDRYRGIHGDRRVVLANADDLDRLGLVAGQVVTLRSHHAGQVREAPDFVVVPYDIPQGCVATYFPEANVLVPIDSMAKGSKTPASKRVVVRVVASGA